MELSFNRFCKFHWTYKNPSTIKRGNPFWPVLLAHPYDYVLKTAMRPRISVSAAAFLVLFLFNPCTVWRKRRVGTRTNKRARDFVINLDFPWEKRERKERGRERERERERERGGREREIVGEREREQIAFLAFDSKGNDDRFRWRQILFFLRRERGWLHRLELKKDILVC